MQRLPRKISNKYTRDKFNIGSLLRIVIFLLAILAIYKVSYYLFYKPIDKTQNIKNIQQSHKNDKDIKVKGKIIILITNLGLNTKITNQAFQLHQNISLGFSPYAWNLSHWLQRASKEGKNALINIPMQEHDYYHADPGPYALDDELESSSNIKRLGHIFNMAQDANGVYSRPEEAFTIYYANAGFLLDKLKKQDILYLYFDSNHTKALANIARLINYYKCKRVDVQLDEIDDVDAILRRFKLLEAVSKNEDIAVGSIGATAQNIDVLRRWIENLDEEIELVGLHELLALLTERDRS